MLPIPTPTSREALYQELWTRPIPELLNRYGVCELTFLTTCRRLHLPVPARPLWPRIAAGERFQPPPLSPWAGRRPPAGPIPLSDTEMARRMAVKAAAAAAQERQQPITVPDRLLDPHPLVKATATALRQTGNTDRAEGTLPNMLTGALDIRVSRGCLDRALRIADTLLKALALHDITAGIDPKTGTTQLRSGDITLTLAISEQIVAAARRPPGRRTTVGDAIPVRPTAMLTITVRGWVQRQWHDASKTPLERRLRGIVIGIIELIEEQRHRQAEHQTRESEMEAAQSRYQAAVRQRSEEADRLRGLLRDAVRLERANRIRALASAVEAQATAQGTLDDAKRNWLDWARGKADWIDPVTKAADPVLDGPEPKRPQLWRA
ncbi:MAG: hypothetical protein LW862_10390 [Rubrivivax sp.]|nr:hypothetical protein [Rubrivivax sp.]